MAMPYWWFHKFGVEPKTGRGASLVCSLRERLDALCELEPQEARTRRRPFKALDSDRLRCAWSPWVTKTPCPLATITFADHVAWAMAGEMWGDDKRMLELLAPFAGHRLGLATFALCKPRSQVRPLGPCPLPRCSSSM